MLAPFNFANALATNEIKGTSIDPARLLGNADFNNPHVVSDRLTGLVLADDIGRQTRDAMEKIASKEPARAGEQRGSGPI